MKRWRGTSFLVIGVFTGLQAAFSSVALPLSVGVTALLIDLFGYRSIFVMLAVTMVFDVVLLLSVDNDAAREQVRSVVAEERAVAVERAVLGGEQLFPSDMAGYPDIS